MLMSIVRALAVGLDLKGLDVPSSEPRNTRFLGIFRQRGPAAGLGTRVPEL